MADNIIHLKSTTLTDVLFNSDDFDKHHAKFMACALAMIDTGIATPQDFKDHGGWVKAPMKPDTYFVFVADASKVENRYYLNVRTGELFQ